LAKPAKSKTSAKQDAKTTDELAKLVKGRAAIFASNMTRKLKKVWAEALTVAKKAVLEKHKAEAKGRKPDVAAVAAETKELEKKIPTFSMSVSKSIVSTAMRGGGNQGYLAIKGWTSTCSSAHMKRAAMHVEVKANRGGTTKTVGMGLEDYFPSSYKHSDHVIKKDAVWAILSFAEFAKIWSAELTTAKLADWSGANTKFVKADPWHVELPRKKIANKIDEDAVVQGTRPGRSGKIFDKCVNTYADYMAHMDFIGNTSTNTDMHNKFERKYKTLIEKRKKSVKAALTKEKEKKKKDADRKKFDKTVKDKAKKLLSTAEADLIKAEKEAAKEGATLPHQH